MVSYSDNPPPGIPKLIALPCGAMAHWDYESACGYICEDCLCIVGSVSQPRECRKEKD
jgi:hypothetical protein